MELVEALRSHGIAAAISGAGPAVIALAVDGDGVGLAARISSMVGADVQVLVPGVADMGVRVL